MSREFSLIMEAMAGDTVEEKIKAFSDVLDKITQFSVNSIDQATRRMRGMNGLLDNLEKRIITLEQRPPPVMAGSIGAPGVPAPIPGPAAPPPPPPEPKPATPISARAALQSELKALFARRKQ